MFTSEHLAALNDACDKARASNASVEVFYDREVMLIVTRDGRVGIEVYDKDPNFLTSVLLYSVSQSVFGSLHQEGNRVLFEPRSAG